MITLIMNDTSLKPIMCSSRKSYSLRGRVGGGMYIFWNYTGYNKVIIYNPSFSCKEILKIKIMIPVTSLRQTVR